MNSLLSALSLAAFLIDPRAAIAPSLAERERTYWVIVEQYARGERLNARNALNSWTSEGLDEMVRSISALARAAGKCGGCAPRTRFDALPLRAAVLLHGEWERAARLNHLARNQGTTECSTGVHAAMSERLLEFASRQPGGERFVARFAAAMSGHYRGTVCFAHAIYWAEAGLKRSPRSAELLLARGLAQEAVGELGFSQSSPLVQPPSRLGPALASETRDKREWFNLAREAFEGALAIDPGSDEAEMRLGRVQWRLGQLPKARASLERALGRSQGPTLFLTHLFLGRVLEESAELEGAIAEYRAALAMEPQIQTAAIALAHARALRGNAEGAREVLESVLPLAGRRATVQRYWDCLIGTPMAAERLMEALRIETAR